MRTTRHASWRRTRRCALLATLAAAVLAPAMARESRAAEIIPSVGITKSTREGGEPARVYGGLALRGSFLPLLKSEVGVAYRRETRLDGNLEVKMWPVTASLWLTPIPALYAGGGVGWYHTTLDYAAALPVADETHQEFGMHVGGGLAIPITGSAAIDLNGRYVFMDSQQTQLPPTRFDPDYWSTTLGLAIRF
ncbi:MAG: outer membrane protein [Candidatus Eiseniibacteriota bacterium]